MNRIKVSYLKLMAVAAVLAITLIGLSGVLNMTTAAQDRITLPPREIDLRPKLKDKKFEDGRRVEIQTLDTGEKIVAEIKNGEFLNWFLVNPDGTEVKGEVKRKHSTTTTTVVCTSTLTTTVTKVVDGKPVTTTTTTTVIITCPKSIANSAS